MNKKYSITERLFGRGKINEAALDLTELETTAITADKLVAGGEYLIRLVGGRSQFANFAIPLDFTSDTTYVTDDAKRTAMISTINTVKADPALLALMPKLAQDLPAADLVKLLSSDERKALTGGGRNPLKLQPIRDIATEPANLITLFLAQDKIDMSKSFPPNTASVMYVLQVDSQNPKVTVQEVMQKPNGKYKRVKGARELIRGKVYLKRFDKEGNASYGTVRGFRDTLGDAFAVGMDIKQLRTANIIKPGELYSSGIGDEAKNKFNAMSDQQKAAVTSFLTPGTFYSWSEAFNAIYPPGTTPTIHNSSGPDSKPLVEAELVTLFNETVGDAGRGETLIASIFPLFVTIGAAGAAAGVDLVDVVNDRNYEVKEPNFRSGTKGRPNAGKLIDDLKGSLVEIKKIISIMKADKKSLYTFQKVKADVSAIYNVDPSAPRSRPTLEQDDAFSDYLAEMSGCKACDEQVWAVLESRVQSAFRAQSDTEGQTFIDQALDDHFDTMTAQIDQDLAMVKKGEVPQNRALEVETLMGRLHYGKYVNKSKGSIIKDLPLFAGAISNTGDIDFVVLKQNILDAYAEAVNPEKAFADTNIIICNESGYRVYTPLQLKEAIRQGLAKAGVTQGLLGMNIPDITQGPLVNMQQSSSTQLAASYNRDLLGILTEWAVK